MRILVCPLDWGLGHATRCIPLVRALSALGHEVRIGAWGGGLELLRSEFPRLECFAFPGYRIRYARRGWAFLPVLLLQAPRILAGLRAENRRLRRELADHPADVVISDGRYGLKVPGIPCILITHQIAFRVPGLIPGRRLAERAALALNLAWLRRFDRVWVPDFSGARSLSGTLGHPPGVTGNLEWIGPLCRFAPGEAAPAAGIDIAAVISGPEPQRSLFESAVRARLSAMGGTRVLVRGLPGKAAGPGLEAARPGALTEFDHLPGRELARLFSGASLLIARSGYTTVMELAGLGARAAILVPTPGQSEQEHLAAHLEAAGACVRMEQDSLDPEAGRERAAALPGFRDWADGEVPATGLAAFLAAHPLFRNGAQQ